MTIAASNCIPDFSRRRRLVAEDLRNLSDPAVIFEHAGVDSDGAKFWVYTVAGWLNGENVATIQGGATVGGEVIIVAGKDRGEADMLAGLGLGDTIDALDSEEKAYIDAHAAHARLASVGPIERINQSLKKPGDMSDRFVQDTSLQRKLAGDDIALTTGHGLH